MKKIYFLILFALSSQFLFAQTVRRAKPGGTGDGSTWALAGDLQTMINNSASGDEVWVSAGKYLPTEKLQANVYNSTTVVGVATTDRDRTFIMKGGVKVYGGFIGDGSETLLSQRNYITNVTILSGDLNNDNVASTGDFYHVVSSRNTATGAVLDGFTIQHGYADGAANVSGNGTDGLSALTISQKTGAGVAVRGPNNTITFNNLIIQNNYADDSAGAMSLYISGSGTFPLNNIVFRNNTSLNEGGAIRIYSTSGTFVVNMSNLTFDNNKSTATDGGAIRIYVNADISTYNISNSTFINNYAASRGGAIYSYGASATVYPIVNIVNSMFYNNTSASATLGGGALAITTGSKTTLINNTFYNNRATNAGGLGGAIHIGSSASCQLTSYNNIFSGNTAAGSSGAYPDIYKGVAAPAVVIKNTLSQVANYSTNGVDGNIINANPTPLFASTTSTDPLFLALVEGVATEKGDNTLAAGITTDLAGNPRIAHTNIDLGAYEYQGVLPVELLYFNATPSGNAALLTWKTAKETNSQKFTIERGTSLANFSLIKEISTVGNSSEPKLYSFTDKYPVAGANYYRLTQYDNDGTPTDLGVKSVNFSLSKTLTKLYPNPASESVTIKLTDSFAEGVTVNLISLMGKTVLTKNYASGDLQEISLNLTEVPAGTYIVWLNKGKANAEKQTLLVVK